MLKEKWFSSRLGFVGGFIILLLPFVLIACGGEAATLGANQTTGVTNVTTVSSNSPTPAVVKQTQVPSPAPTTTQPPVASKTITKPTSSTGSSKAPKNGEEACALVTKEEASALLEVVVDQLKPEATTGFSCNYYVGEQLILQVFFEKVKGSKSLVDSYKIIYPDAQLIPGVGDYNWWSAESGRFELFQGSSNFDLVMLSGETNKAKLLEQATQLAQLVISRIK